MSFNAEIREKHRGAQRRAVTSVLPRFITSSLNLVCYADETQLRGTHSTYNEAGDGYNDATDVGERLQRVKKLLGNMRSPVTHLLPRLDEKRLRRAALAGTEVPPVPGNRITVDMKKRWSGQRVWRPSA